MESRVLKEYDFAIAVFSETDFYMECECDSLVVDGHNVSGYVRINATPATYKVIQGINVTACKIRDDFNGVIRIHLYKNNLQTHAKGMFKDLKSLVAFTAHHNTFRNVRNIESAWDGCGALVAFPAIDVGNVVNTKRAWGDCLAMADFPDLNYSDDFVFEDDVWVGCKSLTFKPVTTPMNVNLKEAFGSDGIHNDDNCDTIEYDFSMMFESDEGFTVSFTGEYLIIGGNKITQSPAHITARDNKIFGVDIKEFNILGGGKGITAIHLEKNSEQVNASHMFVNLRDLAVFTANPTTFGNVTSMNNTWYDCTSLTHMDPIDIRNVTVMLYAWGGCRSLENFPDLDYNNAVHSEHAWDGCTRMSSPLIVGQHSSDAYFRERKDDVFRPISGIRSGGVQEEDRDETNNHRRTEYYSRDLEKHVAMKYLNDKIAQAFPTSLAYDATETFVRETINEMPNIPIPKDRLHIYILERIVHTLKGERVK